MIELSEQTMEILRSLFPKESWNEVEQFLALDCADNIPSCKSYDKYEMERIRFSVLKLSEGSIEKLVDAIVLAQTDWRDLFMAAAEQQFFCKFVADQELIS